VPVDQDDIAAALLQVQCRGDADHTRAQYNNVGLELHLTSPKSNACVCRPPLLKAKRYVIAVQTGFANKAWA
jgi:hypothetical protein